MKQEQTPQPGRFGFELELPNSPQQDTGDSPAAHAIRITIDLLQATTTNDNDRLQNIADQLHPRALRKLASWLEFLHRSGAGVQLEFDSRSAEIAPHQMQDAAARLKEMARGRPQPTR